MEFKVMEITPEMARRMLERNHVNRTLNKARAAQYAEDMKAGRWELNGEAIKFYADKSLADGQHRLTGIIIANVPILTLVISGLDKSIAIQDRGRNRSTADVMRLRGYDKELSNHTIVAMARLHYDVQMNKKNIPDGLIEAFIAKHADVLMRLANMQKGGWKGAPKGPNVDAAIIKLPCFYAINSGECNEEQIYQFLKVLRTGIPESLDQMAAVVCRNDILAGAINVRGGSGERKKSVFQVEKAINDFVAGYKRKQSYKAWNEPIYSCHANNKED